MKPYQRNVGQLLLDVAHNLALRRGDKAVTALRQQLDHPVGHVAPSHVDTQHGVGEGVTLVDRDGVGHTVTGVQHNPGGPPRGVQGEDSLDPDVHGRAVEGLEHDLRHLLAVRLRVHRGLCEEDRVVLRGNTQLVEEGVVPDLLHVVPVRDDTVLDRVLDQQDTTLRLCVVANVGLLLCRPHHGGGSLRAPHDGGEHGTRGVIPGEPGLHHPGPVVAHDRLLVIVRHCGEVSCCFVVSWNGVGGG